MSQPALDPHAILQQIGLEGVERLTPVTGGMDTAIWKVQCADAAFALRLFRAEQKGTCEIEAAAMEAAAAAGLPVPTLHATGEWEGRPYMLIAWCKGDTVGNTLFRQPWRGWSLAVKAGRLQAKLHTVKAPPYIVERRSNWIRWGTDHPRLTEILRATATRTDVLLHMDYHPHNVLIDGDQVTAVIDWTCAFAGDPRADVARSVTLIRLGYVGRGLKAKLFDLVRFILAAGWLRGYQQVAGPLRDMAPFYLWAGALFKDDMSYKIGRPGIDLTAEDLKPADRWIARWRRRVGV